MTNRDSYRAINFAVPVVNGNIFDILVFNFYNRFSHIHSRYEINMGKPPKSALILLNWNFPYFLNIRMYPISSPNLEVI